MSYGAAIEAQGSLVALAARISHKKKMPPAHRGIVTVFSRGSRRRLIKKMRRLAQGVEKAFFVTLTYPERFPDGTIAKQHQRALMERIRRLHPEASAIWRIEYQKRGAPHFHHIWFNLPYIPQQMLRDMWSEIIAEYITDQKPFVRIEMVRSRRGIMYYVGKYVAKMGHEEDHEMHEGQDKQGLFNSVSYLHAGRWWGIHNQAALPWGIKIKIVFTAIDHRQFMAAKRILAREYAKVDMGDANGATVFTELAYIVLREMETELRQCQKQMFICG